MKIWMLTFEYEYEGTSGEWAFSTLQLAEQHRDDLLAGGDYEEKYGGSFRIDEMDVFDAAPQRVTLWKVKAIADLSTGELSVFDYEPDNRHWDYSTIGMGYSYRANYSASHGGKVICQVLARSKEAGEQAIRDGLKQALGNIRAAQKNRAIRDAKRQKS